MAELTIGVTRKICGKIFSMANDIFSLVCKFCGDDFQTLENLRAHIAEHFPESPSLNSEIDSNSVEVHDDVKYNITDNLESSQEEDPSTSILKSVENNQSDHAAGGDKYGMQNANRTRHDESEAIALTTQFQCDICQGWTTRKSNIRQHLRNKNSSQRIYDCDVCSNSFGQKSHLSRHLNIHIREKCDGCRKTLLQKKRLTAQTLCSKIPHTCVVCNRSFSKKYILVDHMTTHTGEKIFECDICQRFFSTKSNVKSHMAYTHSKRPYECRFCSQSFVIRVALSEHLNSHR